MIEFKFLIPPIVALTLFAERALTSLSSTFRLAIDLAAICTLAAGFLILGRLRGALSASEASADAWKAERDAAVVRADRHRDEMEELRKEKEAENRDLLIQVSDFKVEIIRLQERPSLEIIAAKLDVMNDQLNKGRDEVAVQILEAIERKFP